MTALLLGYDDVERARAFFIDALGFEEEWEVRFEQRRYVFPKSDVAVLPIDNTTAERIGEWFASGLLAFLDQEGAKNVLTLTVGIEEMPGQTGWYTVRR